MALWDSFTSFYSIIGIFDQLAVSALPQRVEKFMLYLQISEGLGQYSLSVELQDLVDGAVLFRQDVSVLDFADRLDVFEFVLVFEELSITHPGTYDCLVFADQRELARQRIEIVLEGDSNDET